MPRWLLPAMAILLAAGVAVWLFAAPSEPSDSGSPPSSVARARTETVAQLRAPSPGEPGAPATAQPSAAREQLYAAAPSAAEPAQLVAIAKDVQRGSRERNEACAALRRLGPLPEGVDGSELHGVVMDVPLNEGTDTVAIYADGSSRYVNFAGFSRRLEQPSGEVLASSKRVIEVARGLAPQIAPGDHLTTPVSQKSSRFTFLLCGGERLIVRTPGDGDELGLIYKGAAEILPRIIDEGVKEGIQAVTAARRAR